MPSANSYENNALPAPAAGAVGGSEDMYNDENAMYESIPGDQGRIPQDPPMYEPIRPNSYRVCSRARDSLMPT